MKLKLKRAQKPAPKQNHFVMPQRLKPLWTNLINELSTGTPALNKILITGNKASGKTTLSRLLTSVLNWPTLISYDWDLENFINYFNDFNQPKHCLIIEWTGDCNYQNRNWLQFKTYLDNLNEQALLIVVANQNPEVIAGDFNLVIDLDLYYQSDDLINIIDYYQARLVLDDADINLLKKIISDQGLGAPVHLDQLVQILKSFKVQDRNGRALIYRNLLYARINTNHIDELENYLEQNNYHEKEINDMIFADIE